MKILILFLFSIFCLSLDANGAITSLGCGKKIVIFEKKEVQLYYQCFYKADNPFRDWMDVYEHFVKSNRDKFDIFNKQLGKIVHYKYKVWNGHVAYGNLIKEVMIELGATCCVEVLYDDKEIYFIRAFAINGKTKDLYVRLTEKQIQK